MAKECPDCGGSGYVECPRCGTEEMEECLECEGTGEVDE